MYDVATCMMWLCLYVLWRVLICDSATACFVFRRVLVLCFGERFSLWLANLFVLWRELNVCGGVLLFCVRSWRAFASFDERFER